MKVIADKIKEVVDSLDREDLVDQTVAPEITPEPDPSTEQVLAIVSMLQDIAAHNGYLGIARTVGVSTSTVKEVQEAVSERLAEIAEVINEQIEPK